MEGHHAEEDHKKEVETKDHGMFDFMKKKHENVTMPDAHKPDNAKEEQEPTLMENLHRSNSNSSSSSDEEQEGENSEKKRKKKGLKEKIKEKISGDKEVTEHKDTSIPTENPDEKNGKIKEKLPGNHKKAEDGVYDGHPADGEPKEKGILEKIKEKIPGCHRHKTIRLRLRKSEVKLGNKLNHGCMLFLCLHCLSSLQVFLVLWESLFGISQSFAISFLLSSNVLVVSLEDNSTWS